MGYSVRLNDQTKIVRKFQPIVTPTDIHPGIPEPINENLHNYGVQTNQRSEQVQFILNHCQVRQLGVLIARSMMNSLISTPF